MIIAAPMEDFTTSNLENILEYIINQYSNHKLEVNYKITTLYVKTLYIKDKILYIDYTNTYSTHNTKPIKSNFSKRFLYHLLEHLCLPSKPNKETKRNF